MGTADLHIHSIYSADATITVRAILRQAKDVGLNVIAVTNHDEICGSLEAHALAPKYGIKSIPAAEISTRDGHLVALWINELPLSWIRRITLKNSVSHQISHPINTQKMSQSFIGRIKKKTERIISTLFFSVPGNFALPHCLTCLINPGVFSFRSSR